METELEKGRQNYKLLLVLEKCKTLRGEPELIMSCTHDSLKFWGAGIYLIVVNDSYME